jgi:hypothetical protein
VRESSSLGAGLFGRHVGDGAESGTRTGEVLVIDGGSRRVGRSSLGGRTSRGRDFGQTEIENLGVSALGDKNVGGLDVAMDDALGVRGVEAVCNVNADRKNGFDV